MLQLLIFYEKTTILNSHPFVQNMFTIMSLYFKTKSIPIEQPWKNAVQG